MDYCRSAIGEEDEAAVEIPILQRPDIRNFVLTFPSKAFIILLNFTYWHKGSDEEEYIGFRKPREKMAGVNLREEGMEVASELRS